MMPADPSAQSGAKAERFCTVHHPYDAAQDDGSWWVHPSASCTYDGDYYDRYECPICGLSFKVEVAQ